ncbi:MAG TPA: M56 family metallopeptidase [Gemmatimonas sp.]|uniref:M56 family metallopeptidase n=1 Tax=Gemmatimonas sp. TaxID=1962908 RepID=UPI002EDB6645
MNWRVSWKKPGGDVESETPRYWLRAGTIATEARYRRSLILALAAILLLSLAPVVGRHVLVVVDRPLSGIDHLGVLCLIALHELMAPVHALLHVLVGGGALMAIGERLQLAWKGNILLRQLSSVPASADVHRQIVRAGLDPTRVRVVEGLPMPAFTTGWWRPRVYLAQSLLDGANALSDEEVVAVLAHEAEHVRRRDPLRFALLRALSRTLFWIPAIGAIAEDIADEAEIHADDAASRRTDPLTLAGALVKLGAWRIAPPHTRIAGDVVGFVRGGILDRRVRRLAGEGFAPRSRLTTRAMLGALAALCITVASGIVDIHGMPLHPTVGQPAAGHCAHEGLTSYRHLFCRWGIAGTWLPRGGADCPHFQASL